MTTPFSEQVFNRPPRIRHTWPRETVVLPEPPVDNERRPAAGWLTLGMPILSAGVMVGAMAALGSGSAGLVLGVPMLLMAVMGVITTVMMNRAQARREAAERARRQAFFEGQLAECGDRLRQLFDQEQRLRREASPPPEVVLRVAGALGSGMRPQERLWERRIADEDFLELRLGPGCLPCSTTVQVPPQRPEYPVEPRLAELAERFRTIAEVPITLPLRELGTLGLAGPRDQALALLRSLIWQAAVFHAPEDLRIAVIHHAHASQDWAWASWLPHTVPFNNDADYNVRMRASDDRQIEQLMSALLDQLSRRRDIDERQQGSSGAPAGNGAGPTPVLVIVDGVERVRNQPVLSEIMRAGARYNMLAIFLVERWEEIPSECGAMVDLGSAGPRWARAGQKWTIERFSPDGGELNKSDQLARQLASLKLAESGSGQDVPRNVRFFELYGIKQEGDLERRLREFWAQPPQPREAWHLDVPIGLKAGGQPLYLHLHQHADGSHGIIAGFTGSGKSVLLQSLVAALALRHSPRHLSLLFLDFKGGASLARLAQLPHCVGFVSDLEGRLAERAMIAIKSELHRRKQLLNEASHSLGYDIQDFMDYRERAEPHGWAPLPNLLICIDEFDEMVQSYRDFVSELVRVVKQGRSLGVHLLVASQQPAKAVTNDIRDQLKYFIALRLGSSQDSREMLEGKPDAAFLPSDVPGRGYFRSGRQNTLFQAAQLTGAYYLKSPDAQQPNSGFIIHWPGQAQGTRARAAVSASVGERTTDLDVLVRTLRSEGATYLAEQRARSGWAPRPIWEQPLPSRLTLSEIWQSGDDGQPLDLARPLARGGWLEAPIGRLDIPHESRQEPYVVRLRDAHLAVIGASGSGKTVQLRSLALSLAVRHAPHELWIYAIDAGGQGLGALANLPHVGALIQPRDRDRVRRLINVIDRELNLRQERFRELGVGDLESHNRQADEPLPAWVIIIDKIALLREEFKDSHGHETISEDLIRLARVSRPYGVHFVVTADSVRDMGHQLFALFDGRIALHMPDLHAYTEVLDGRTGSQIPASKPGRAFVRYADHDLLEMQTALPMLERGLAQPGGDGTQAALLDSELNTSVKSAVAQIHALWASEPGRLPRPIELLPDRLTLSDLAWPALAGAAPPDALRIPFGLEGADMGTATLVLDRDTPHALVIGGKRSGKTTVLQSLALGLAHQHRPDELRLAVIDPRRGLRALRELPHVGLYADSAEAIERGLGHLERLAERPDLMERWVVVIDDWDLGYKNLEGQFKPSYDRPNLFSVLKRLLLEGADRNLHMLIAANLRFPEEAGEVVRSLDALRNGLILWPHKFDGGTRLLDVGLPLGERTGNLPPGRALLVREAQQVLTQVAVATPAGLRELAENAVYAEVAHHGR